MDIQAEINAAGYGTTVTPPADTYMVDAVNASLTLKAGVTLDLSGGAVLQAIPNDARTYRIVKMASGSRLLGGTVRGERDQHTDTRAPGELSEWGLGVCVEDAEDVTIDGTRAEKCWGDGFYVQKAKNVQILKVIADGNRRQGMSVIDVDGLNVEDGQWMNTGGTRPGFGIDFEPDSPGPQSIRNVTLRRNRFSSNAGGGILIACPPSARSGISIDSSNQFLDGCPIDGTDKITPFYAKWLHQVFGKYWFYPRTISI